LDLSDNGLEGMIPSLGDLRNIVYLNFDSNGLTGDIPPDIGALENLRELSMANNELSGMFPDLSCLINLKRLRLFGNNLQGRVPWSLKHCTRLNSLLLCDNDLEVTTEREQKTKEEIAEETAAKKISIGKRRRAQKGVEEIKGEDSSDEEADKPLVPAIVVDDLRDSLSLIDTSRTHFSHSLQIARHGTERPGHEDADQEDDDENDDGDEDEDEEEADDY
jgi:Leucine-rich repeat (LRR) protein